MGKSVRSNNPFVLGAEDSDQIPVKQQPQQQQQNNPFVLGAQDSQYVKKKAGGDGSASDTSHTPLESPEQAAKAFQDKTLTKQSVDVLAETDAGKKAGLNNMSPDAREVFAEAHNGPKKSDLVNSVNGILDTYYPKGPDPSQNKKSFNLKQSVLQGNQDAIIGTRDNIIQGLQKKIDQRKNEIYRPLPGTLGAKQYSDALLEADPTIQELKAQQKKVTNSFNEYGKQSLVSSKDMEAWLKLDESHPNIQTSIAAEKLGKQVEEKYGADRETPNKEHDRMASGMRLIMQSLQMDVNEALAYGIPTKNPELLKKAQDKIATLARYRDMYEKLDTEQFPDVGLDKTARFLGDIIAEKHPNKLIRTAADVREAGKIANERNPGFMDKYGKFVETAAQKQDQGTFIPRGGGVLNELVGGVVSASARNALDLLKWKARAGTLSETDKTDLSRETSPGMRGTTQSGTETTKITYDKEGKAYRELPNENYSTLPWNNFFRFAGESAPGLAEFIAAEGTTKVATEALSFGRAGAATKDFAGLLGATYLTSYNSNREFADANIDDKTSTGEAKKIVLANLLTVANAGVFHALGASPSKIVEKAISKSVAPDVLEVLEKNSWEQLSQKTAEKLLKDKILPRAKAIVQKFGENLEGGAKMGAASVIDQKIHDLAGVMTNTNYKPSTVEDNARSFVQQALLMTIVGLPGMISSGAMPHSTREALHEAGLYGPQYIDRINERVQNGELDPVKANGMIAMVKTMHEELGKAAKETNDDGTPLTIHQQRDLAIANFRKRAAASMEEQGLPVSKEGAESEADKDIKNIKQQNNWQSIEDTPTFKSIKEFQDASGKGIEKVKESLERELNIRRDLTDEDKEKLVKEIEKTGKRIEEIKSQKPVESLSDIDPAGRYYYNKEGKVVLENGSDLIHYLETGDIYEKEKPDDKKAPAEKTENTETKGKDAEDKEAPPIGGEYKPNIRDDYFAKADFFTPEEKTKFESLDDAGKDKMIDDKRAELKSVEPAKEKAAAPIEEEPDAEANANIANHLQASYDRLIASGSDPSDPEMKRLQERIESLSPKISSDNEKLEKQLPDTLSPEEKRGSIAGGKANAESIAITGRIHRTDSGGEKRGKEGLFGPRFKQPSDTREIEALTKYAKENGLWVDKPFGKPDAEGVESSVYFNPETQTVTKVNIGTGYESWNEFFHKIGIHNALFPDTKYEVKGFTEHNGKFAVVLEQPLIIKGEKSVSEKDIEEDMKDRGFDLVDDLPAFYNKKTGVSIMDTNDGNVIWGADGNLHYIDPVIEKDVFFKKGWETEWYKEKNDLSNIKTQTDGNVKTEQSGDSQKEGIPEGQESGQESKGPDKKGDVLTPESDTGAEKPPEDKPAPTPENISPIVGIRDSIVNSERIHKGLKPLVKEFVRSWGSNWNELKRNIANGFSPRKFIEETAARIGKGERVTFSDYDYATLLFDRLDIQNNIARATDELNDVISKQGDSTQPTLSSLGERTAAEDLLNHYNAQLEQNDIIGRALKSESGRALSAIQMMTSMNGELLKWSADINNYYNGHVPEAIKKFVERIEKEYKEKNEQLREHYEEQLKKAAEQAFKDAQKATTSTKAPAKKSVKAAGKDLADRIRALRPKSDGNLQASLFGLPIAVYDTALVAIANAVEAGAKLVDAINEALKDVKFDREEDRNKFMAHLLNTEDPERAEAKQDSLIRDIKSIAKENDATNLVPDAVKPLRDLMKSYVQNGDAKTLEELVNKTYEALKDAMPDIEERDIRDAFSGHGMNPDSEGKVKSELTKLKEQARAVSEYQDLLERPTGETKAQEQKRLTKAAELYKKVQGYMREMGIDEKPEPTTPEGKKALALEQAKKRTQSVIDDLNRQILAGERKERNNVEPDHDLSVLRAERKRLSEQLDQIDKSNVSPEEKIKKIEDALNRQISNYERQIREGVDPLKPKEDRPTTKQIEDLRKRKKELKSQVEGLRNEADPRNDPKQKALAKYNEGLARQIAKLDEKIETKNYEPDTKPPVDFTRDNVSLALEARLKKLQSDFYATKRAGEAINKKGIQKAMSLAAATKRAFVLSRISTFGRLGAAVGWNTIFEPAEATTGAIMYAGTKLGFGKNINKIAERYGVPTSGALAALVKGEVEAFKALGNPQTWKDFVSDAKNGYSELSLLYGHGNESVPKEARDTWMNIEHGLESFGRAHGAVKGVSKRMEFMRSYAIRKEALKRKGTDVNNPVIQQSIGAMAYQDALRSILMEDNYVSEKYQKAIHELQKGGFGANVLALTLQEMMPIVKIPTNLVLNAGRATLGTPLAGGAIAVRGLIDLISGGKSEYGISKLSASEADAILRNLRKGNVGMALMLAGFFAPNLFGASHYYKKGTDQPEGLEEGEVKFLGVTIPKWLADNPYLVTMKIGSSLRNSFDYYTDEKDQEAPQAAVSSFVSTAIDALKETPLLGTPSELIKTAEGYGGNWFWYSQVKGTIEPGLLQEIAEDTDNANNEWWKVVGGDRIKRKPQSLGDALKTGLPGARETVDEK